MGLLFFSTVRADDDCGEVPTLAGPRGPLHDMPTFDQPNNTCWAHAAVELTQAWVQSHPPIPEPPAPVPPPPGGSGYVPSPVVLAQRMGHALGVDTTGAKGHGIQVARALEFLRAHGTCDQMAVFGDSFTAFESTREVRMRSDLADSLNHYNSWINGHLRWLEDRAADLMTRHPDWDLMHVKAQAFYEGALESGQARLLCDALRSDFGAANMPRPFNRGNLYQLLAAMMVENKTADEFLNDYYRRACRDHTAPAPIPAAHPVGITDNVSGLALINKRLDRPNPQPVEIDICAGMFDRPNAQLRKFRAPSGKDVGFLGCTDDTHHAVVVVGRRRDPDSPHQCQYLLRNSWGTGCFKYEAAHTGHCDEHSDVWVDGSLIAPNLYQVTYLGD